MHNLWTSSFVLVLALGVILSFGMTLVYADDRIVDFHFGSFVYRIEGDTKTTFYGSAWPSAPTGYALTDSGYSSNISDLGFPEVGVVGSYWDAKAANYRIYQTLQDTTSAIPSDATAESTGHQTTVNISTALNNTAITLRWIEPDLGGSTLLGYQIVGDTDNPPNNIIVSNTGNSLTNYNVTGLNSATEYFFNVTAITSDGMINFGDIIDASTTDPASPVKNWMKLLDKVGINNTFGLEIGLAGLVMIFGAGLAQKNIVYGSVVFGIVLGFAMYFGVIELPTTIVSTIIFFIILIVFSAKNKSLN